METGMSPAQYFLYKCKIEKQENEGAGEEIRLTHALFMTILQKKTYDGS